MNEFRRFWTQQLATLDCDPGVYALKYLSQRQELNTEQMCWLCWLYANTYNVATAWVIFNEFPDYLYATEARMARFEAETRGRLLYQKDQKWLRGHLTELFTRYRDAVGLSQVGFYRTDFPTAWARVTGIKGIGRYTAWMLLQAVSEVVPGITYEPVSLELGWDSSKQHRAGLCRALGLDSWIDQAGPFTRGQLEYLDGAARELLVDVQESFPELKVVRPSLFSMETSLCAYSKLFRLSRGRYLGFYLDRWAEDITKMEAQQWPGISWDLLWECRNEGLDIVLNTRSGVNPAFFSLYLYSGHFCPFPGLEGALDNWYNSHPNPTLL